MFGPVWSSSRSRRIEDEKGRSGRPPLFVFDVFVEPALLADSRVENRAFSVDSADMAH
jgi:hypothetical protein